MTSAVAARDGSPQRQIQSASRRKGSEWEILDNLDPGSTYPIRPRRHEGTLSKKRKWPLKGWHHRFGPG